MIGAGRGLGAAFAVVLAEDGAHVMMTGRNTENLTLLPGPSSCAPASVPKHFTLISPIPARPL